MACMKEEIMKLKTSLIFAIFMVTAVFSTQSQTVTTKQTSSQQTIQSTQQGIKNTNTRAINNSKTNWSKIKDMFM